MAQRPRSRGPPEPPWHIDPRKDQTKTAAEWDDGLGLAARRRLVDWIRLALQVHHLYKTPWVPGGPGLNEALLFVFRSGIKEMVLALIGHGASVNSQYPVWKGTMLHVAVQRRWCELLVALLEVGADPLLTDKDGETPLDTAVRFSGGKPGDVIVAELLKHGGLALPQAAISTTFDHEAAFPCEFTTHLDMSVASSTGSALHTAVACDFVEQARTLLEAEPSLVTGLSSTGATPLHLASSSGMTRLLLSAVDKIGSKAPGSRSGPPTANGTRTWKVTVKARWRTDVEVGVRELDVMVERRRRGILHGDGGLWGPNPPRYPIPGAPLGANQYILCTDLWGQTALDRAACAAGGLDALSEMLKWLDRKDIARVAPEMGQWRASGLAQRFLRVYWPRLYAIVIAKRLAGATTGRVLVDDLGTLAVLCTDVWALVIEAIR